ncbi:hypothetical protein ABZ951_21775 [Streptomyces sp. NPDC046215]
MATTQDIRKVATDTAYAAAGAADLTAEKIGQLVAEAPERFGQLRKTDPKAVQEKVTLRAKEAQATVSAKFTVLAEALDSDLKKLSQTAQDLALQGVGQAVGYAARAGEQYEKLAERGRVAVKTWRNEAAEEVTEIAVAIEPESARAAQDGPAGGTAARDEAPAGAPAADETATDEAATGETATGESADAEGAAKPAAKKTTARKPAAKKTDAKSAE